MNKLTKIGASALCGSLAAISSVAKAGDLTVSGAADMSWISLDDETVGNPIGISSNVSFAGSGELDNGVGVAFALDNTNAQAYSNARITVTVPSMGDFRIDHGLSGTGIDRFDDATPTAWEEAYGWGVSSGIINVAGGSAGSTIEYTPNMTPDGITVHLAFTPHAGGSNAGDKTGSGDGGGFLQSAWDATIEADSSALGFDGLSLYAGYADIGQDSNSGAVNGDSEEYVFGAKYAVGSFTIGYQYSEDDMNQTSFSHYINEGYGVVFNVNDDLSLSYNHYESEKDLAGGTDVTLSASSMQVAYSMGGASIRLATGGVDNKNYQTGAANQRDGTVLSVSLAF
jgi:hypothetical protein